MSLLAGVFKKQKVKEMKGQRGKKNVFVFEKVRSQKDLLILRIA